MSSSSPSHSKARAFEVVDYKVVEDYLGEKFNSAPQLYSGLSATRLFRIDEELRKTAESFLSETFLQVHKRQNFYQDNKTHVTYDTTLEMDYFATFMPPTGKETDTATTTTSSSPSQSKRKQFPWANQQFQQHQLEEDQSPKVSEGLAALDTEDCLKRLVCGTAVDSTRDSGEASDGYVAAIFELTTDPSSVAYKISQLELRLAYYRAYCEKRKRDFSKRVAVCGLVVPKRWKERIIYILQDAKVESTGHVHKNLADMHKDGKFVVLDSIASVPNQDESFGVTDGNAFFEVKPEKPVVWALKKAIMPDKGPLEWSKIIIKAPDGKQVMGDKDALIAGVEYTFVLPPKEGDSEKK